MKGYISKILLGEIKNMLYEYLKENYGENEPILVADIYIAGVTMNTLRQKIKKLTDAGLLKRYDSGIYFIPKQSMFKSGSQLSIDKVITCKYLRNMQNTCGYVSGVTFANQLGLTTQVSMVYEIVTNKATTEYRETSLANNRIILRKPRINISEENYKILQFLDLIKEIDQIAEVSGEELTKCLVAYLKAVKLTFNDLAAYLQFYPDRIYKNLYETGLLYGISA